MIKCIVMLIHLYIETMWKTQEHAGLNHVSKFVNNAGQDLYDIAFHAWNYLWAAFLRELEMENWPRLGDIDRESFPAYQLLPNSPEKIKSAAYFFSKKSHTTFFLLHSAATTKTSCASAIVNR